MIRHAFSKTSFAENSVRENPSPSRAACGDRDPPPPPVPCFVMLLQCCYSHRAFWCIVVPNFIALLLQAHVHNRACLPYQNAHSCTSAQTLSLASTPSIGTYTRRPFGKKFSRAGDSDLHHGLTRPTPVPLFKERGFRPLHRNLQIRRRSGLKPAFRSKLRYSPTDYIMDTRAVPVITFHNY